jgi:hypothetical protein
MFGDKVAKLIGDEMQKASPHTPVDETRYDHKLGRYEIQIGLGDDEHIRCGIDQHMVSLPLSVESAAYEAGLNWDFTGVKAGDLPIEAKLVYDKSWERFRESINHFVQEVAYRVAQHFDWKQLQEIARTLTETEIAILRELKEKYDIVPEWLGMPMQRKEWDNLLPHDKRLQALNRLCELGLAQFHDTFTICIAMIGRGADALSIIDKK